MSGNILDFPVQSGPTIVREISGSELLLSHLKSWLIRNVWRRIPRLVWYGDEVWVRVTLTCEPLGDVSHRVFQVEDQLRSLGISFDTGAGCGGRDWEMDWSLKGPIQITFRGRK